MKATGTIKSSNLFPVVGVGASAGGLEAFKRLLKAIPEDSGMAFVLVQHLDRNHESVLPELLQKATKIPVLEISDEIRVEADHIYVIPSNKMLMANDGILELIPRPEPGKNTKNLPIDLFFTSLAEVHQRHAIGVVLSGTASDGTAGLKAIKEHGGITFAQDEASAAYAEMPANAVRAGVVDFVLSPEEIPLKILEVNRGARADSGEIIRLQDGDVFRQIISLLLIRKGTDFTYYKQTTVSRRILRRMKLIGQESASAYLHFLRENETEQDTLYQDMLIPVTSFFRDTVSFEHLCESALPHIIKNKTKTDPVRIWIAGCSSGQEAYSIAMCFREFLGAGYEKIQIFATDLSSRAISKARSGTYTAAEAATVSPERLSKFFTKANKGYQVNKSIRDMCVFAVHNFLKDPPFCKMDLISCRNVFIYMEPYLQKKALTTFHYALNPKGMLFLGKTETAGSVADLFASVGTNTKLFSRKDVSRRFVHVPGQRSEGGTGVTDTHAENELTPGDFRKTAEDIVLSKYTPSGVIVDELLDIVHFRGNTGNYLQQLPGKPSHNLLKMAKPGLAFELRNLLHKAKKEKNTVIKENIALKVDGTVHSVSIEAIPLPNTIDPYYLVLFHEREPIRSVLAAAEGKTPAKNTLDDKDLRIVQLEQELMQTHEDMSSIMEDQETINQDLQSHNEELLSSSEELQSLNEELETSKEELQSTNEELTVVNQEIVGLNGQLTEARDYAEAIVGTVREPMLVLDKKLRVKTANSSYYRAFQVKESDTEGKLIYEVNDSQWDIPALRQLLEKILPEESTFTGFEIRHTFSAIGERIFLLNARELVKEDGLEKLILLAIEDVTEQRKAEEVQEYAEAIVATVREPMLVLDKHLRVKTANSSYYRAFQVNDKETEGKLIYEVNDSQWNIPALSELLEKILPEESTFRDFEIIHTFAVIGERTMLLNARQLVTGGGQEKLILLAIEDVTEQRKAEEIQRQIQKRFQFIADAMPQKVWTADAHGERNYFNQTWLDYTGLTFEELRDWGWNQAIHYDDAVETRSRWRHSIDTGTDFEMESRFLDKEGVYKWHLSRGLPYKDDNGNVVMWVGTDTEIQEHKKQREELEIAVMKRTADLLKAGEILGDKNDELEKMNKELQSFTYVSSHDLQEPLRKIQTFAARLMDTEHHKLSAKGKDYFVRMQLAASRMRLLIDDLLAFSRVNTTERKYERLELLDILSEVKLDMKEAIEDKQAIVEATGLCAISVIPFQFRQLLNNLISNALKFSRPGVPPHVVIACTVKKGSVLSSEDPALSAVRPGLPSGWISLNKNYCHITVTDNGIGFEPRFDGRIFEVFQKLHPKEIYAGTGIGLAIVKKIVENHHGIITAKGAINKGATFNIYLPAD